MNPQLGLKILLFGFSAIILVCVIGVPGIRKIFQESEKGSPETFSVGLRISLFVFKAVMLFLLFFGLFQGMTLAIWRS